MVSFPVVLSGASGVGKTVLGKLILEADSNLVESISCTTREPRAGEEDGRDYIFLESADFLKMADADKFIEWAAVHGKYYGTPLGWMQDRLDEDTSVFTILDVQGGLQMRKRVPDACLIFLMPPTMQELRKRIRKRGTDSEESMARRLETAREEHKVGLAEYEYIVSNDKIEIALADVLACIRAHRLKRSELRKREIPNGQIN